jgi:hypothetical protein
VPYRRIGVSAYRRLGRTMNGERRTANGERRTAKPFFEDEDDLVEKMMYAKTSGSD